MCDAGAEGYGSKNEHDKKQEYPHCNPQYRGVYITDASQCTNYEYDALDDPHKKLAGNVPSLPAADRRIFFAKLNTFISLDFFGLSFTKSSRVGKQRA